MKRRPRPSRTSPVVLSVQNVSKTFRQRSANPVSALNHVSLQVRQGEIVGLIGPNGAGKSTLLRIMLGFLDADEGSVSLFGQHPESLEARSRTGYQADAQFKSRWLTVHDFLALHSVLLGLPRNGEISKLLGEFSLMEAASRPLSALSKGMRQKVELVLAFLGSPAIVFLDEPTASLDPPSVFELRDFLERRAKSQVTVFFSSHNLTEVEHVCSRVLFISNGQILGDYSMTNMKRGFLERAFRKHLTERPS